MAHLLPAGVPQVRSRAVALLKKVVGPPLEHSNCTVTLSLPRDLRRARGPVAVREVVVSEDDGGAVGAPNARSAASRVAACVHARPPPDIVCVLMKQCARQVHQARGRVAENSSADRYRHVGDVRALSAVLFDDPLRLGPLSKREDRREGCLEEVGRPVDQHERTWNGSRRPAAGNGPIASDADDVERHGGIAPERRVNQVDDTPAVVAEDIETPGPAAVRVLERRCLPSAERPERFPENPHSKSDRIPLLVAPEPDFVACHNVLRHRYPEVRSVDPGPLRFFGVLRQPPDPRERRGGEEPVEDHIEDDRDRRWRDRRGRPALVE